MIKNLRFIKAIGVLFFEPKSSYSIKNNYILSFLFCFILSLSWGQNKTIGLFCLKSNRVEINISFDQEKCLQSSSFIPWV
jgi:hypothetical protein